MSSATQPLRPKRKTSRIRFWVLVSLLVHAELGLLVWCLFYFLAPREAELQARAEAARRAQPESIDISTVDDDAARRIIAELEQQEEKRKAEEAKKLEESVTPPGQVVEIPRPREESRPDKARFVSEFDSSVERETKKFGKFQEDSRLGDDVGKAEAPRKATADAPALRKPSLLAMRSPGTGEKPGGAQSAAGPADGAEAKPDLTSPDGILPKADVGAATGPAMGGQRALSLMPSEQVLSRSIGGGTQDSLQGVDEGNETALNSKRWRFASFFNRVKRQVADHWHPADVYRRRDPTGAIYGRQNRLTILRVQLKPDGSLANVALEHPSGVEFLDDVAIEAFRQAQPFPNPPRQLVESGAINFSFGFLFEINSARMFRFD